jgi:ABC-type sugar transport system ATPase subunit
VSKLASLTLKSVQKSYGPVEAVKALDIDIADGEFIVLFGPSGCGKSTILRMIAGLEPLSGGDIRLDGRLMNDVAPRDRDMAMVFQDYALYPHMSVAANLGFALKMHGVAASEIDRRVTAVARILEMESLLARKPRALSGGQRQRVALGRALVREPRLFLFDEPLSNLDAKLRVSMRMEIRKLQSTLKITSIYVTHDQVEAMTMADRIVVLNDGVVQQLGTPSEVYNQPANVFVGTFIGSPPMSLVSCKLDRQGGAWTLTAADGTRLALPDRHFARPGSTPRNVTLGIRSEHIALAEDGGFVSDVALVEDHGADAIAMITLAGHPVIARLPPSSVKAGDRGRRFSLDLNRIHVFDEATGVAII